MPGRHAIRRLTGVSVLVDEARYTQQSVQQGCRSSRGIVVAVVMAVSATREGSTDTGSKFRGENRRRAREKWWEACLLCDWMNWNQIKRYCWRKAKDTQG